MLTRRPQYVINMTRLKISSALPSVLSAGLLLSLFSSGSSMAFAASRTLYALAIQGQAPKFVAKTNRHGLPYVCVLITLALGCLSFLALSSGTSKGMSPPSVGIDTCNSLGLAHQLDHCNSTPHSDCGCRVSRPGGVAFADVSALTSDFERA